MHLVIQVLMFQNITNKSQKIAVLIDCLRGHSRWSLFFPCTYTHTWIFPCVIVVLGVKCVPGFDMIVHCGLSDHVWLTYYGPLFLVTWSSVSVCYMRHIWPRQIWLAVLLIPRQVRDHSRWSLLFLGTYSHTWVFRVFVLSLVWHLFPALS